MRIDGRSISVHPLAAHGAMTTVRRYRGRYLETADQNVLAAYATDFGTVEVAEGVTQSFQPGDYIVTDDPPTRAWSVPGSAFEVQFEVVG